jgi:hypothetical protein
MVGSGGRSFEVSKRCRAASHGGLGLVHEVTVATGLAKEIDASVSVFHARGPYTESDHVLNLAYNIVCGGRTLDDVELRRQDEALLDLLGAERLPGATTAGDFLRRFERSDIDDLAEAFNETRRRVWRHQSEDFFERAVIDIDGTIAPTDGECKEGQDMAYTGEWGYAPLLTTLANTGEILYARNRPGNRPSHEGAFEYLDPAVELVRSAGFRSVRLRGDCHFALTADFGHWCEARVEFVFGMAAHPTLVKLAEGLDAGSWEPMEREPRSSGDRAGVVGNPSLGSAKRSSWSAATRTSCSSRRTSRNSPIGPGSAIGRTEWSRCARRSASSRASGRCCPRSATTST